MPFRDTKKSGLVFHPNGNLLATGENNGDIVLWDVKSGQCVKILKGHGEGPVVSLQFSNDGRRLLSGGTDKTFRIWDWIAAKPLLTVNQEGYALSASFSPDGLLVASTDSSSAAWIRESLDLAK
jgi:WD40 repeat protein